MTQLSPQNSAGGLQNVWKYCRKLAISLVSLRPNLWDKTLKHLLASWSNVKNWMQYHRFNTLASLWQTTFYLMQNLKSAMAKQLLPPQEDTGEEVSLNKVQGLWYQHTSVCQWVMNNIVHVFHAYSGSLWFNSWTGSATLMCLPCPSHGWWLYSRKTLFMANWQLRLIYNDVCTLDMKPININPDPWEATTGLYGNSKCKFD